MLYNNLEFFFMYLLVRKFFWFLWIIFVKVGFIWFVKILESSLYVIFNKVIGC